MGRYRTFRGKNSQFLNQPCHRDVAALLNPLTKVGLIKPRISQGYYRRGLTCKDLKMDTQENSKYLLGACLTLLLSKEFGRPQIEDEVLYPNGEDTVLALLSQTKGQEQFDLTGLIARLKTTEAYLASSVIFKSQLRALE